jgi:hypothetical protein
MNIALRASQKQYTVLISNRATAPINWHSAFIGIPIHFRFLVFLSSEYIPNEFIYRVDNRMDASYEVFRDGCLTQLQAV